MRYTVIWSPDVENELCEYWPAGGPVERRFLTELSDRIDQDLAVGAERLGIATGDDEFLKRYTFYFLGADVLVEFRLSMDDRLVNILRITAK